MKFVQTVAKSAIWLSLGPVFAVMLMVGMSLFAIPFAALCAVDLIEHTIKGE